MAMINCRECGKEISNQAASCPHCGVPLWRRKKKPSGCAIVFVVVAGLFILGTCVGENDSDKSSSAPAEKGFSDMDALYLCQQAMKSASRDPDKAEVPFVMPSSDTYEYHFSWGASTKRMRMRNGLGLDVPATGSCSVNKTTKRVTYLTINGKTILDGAGSSSAPIDPAIFDSIDGA